MRYSIQTMAQVKRKIAQAQMSLPEAVLSTKNKFSFQNSVDGESPHGEEDGRLNLTCVRSA
jgi:hypothetical protein